MLGNHPVMIARKWMWDDCCLLFELCYFIVSVCVISIPVFLWAFWPISLWCVLFECLTGACKCYWRPLRKLVMVESKERGSHSKLHHIILMSENKTERKAFTPFSAKKKKKKVIFLIHKRGYFFRWKEFFPSH